MSNLEVHFVNGTILNFDVSCDVDLFKITGQYIAFNDLFINIGNVLYINKKKTENETNKKEGEKG